MEEGQEEVASQSFGASIEEEKRQIKREGVSDQVALEFLDSLDGYLTLMDSLSSILRQGWLELASARHSMGSMRVNSALFDLKDHTAATYVQLTRHESDDSTEGQPRFSLQKWESFENGKCYSGEERFTNDNLQHRSDSPQLRERGASQVSETQEKILENDPQLAVHDPVKKERSKLLSVFGALVSPKLRAAQVSFETALDIIVEVANMRSSLLSAHDQGKKGLLERK